MMRDFGRQKNDIAKSSSKKRLTLEPTHSKHSETENRKSIRSLKCRKNTLHRIPINSESSYQYASNKTFVLIAAATTIPLLCCIVTIAIADRWDKHHRNNWPLGVDAWRWNNWGGGGGYSPWGGPERGGGDSNHKHGHWGNHHREGSGQDSDGKQFENGQNSQFNGGYDRYGGGNFGNGGGWKSDKEKDSSRQEFSKQGQGQQGSGSQEMPPPPQSIPTPPPPVPTTTQRRWSIDLPPGAPGTKEAQTVNSSSPDKVQNKDKSKSKESGNDDINSSPPSRR